MPNSSSVNSLPIPFTTPIIDAGPVKVLVVDEDPELRIAVKTVLQKRFDCEFVEAPTSLCALSEIARVRGEQILPLSTDEPEFDIIFLETNLPDRAGLDLLEQLRLQGDITPVVIMTKAGSEEIAVEAMRRGACDYIVKSGDFVPFFPEIASRVIERERMRRYYNRLEAEHVRFARLAAVGEMSAGIAHEIRNPMQVVAGMATLMRDNLEELSAEEIHQCARAISENCAHLQRVLEDVLREAQADVGQEVLQLAELVAETISFMRFDNDFRRYAIVECDFQTPGAVIGSRDQLKQVLINLLRNAAQAIAISGRESGPIRISLSEKSDPREVVLQIQDSGDGIQSDILPRIFESGFSTKHRARNRHQADCIPVGDGQNENGSTPNASRSTPRIQGSGLGLHICQRLIGAHGGRIWAENSTDSDLSGALFCIAFPSADKTH